jgi:acetate kinase
MAPVATTYALPRRWREEWGLRRFGFHGLSHAWASRRAGELLGRADPQLRLVTAHLGSGASLAAVVGGRSVDTSMGFTPLDGLVMSTRPGSLDPGLVLWAQRLGSLSADQVEDVLEHEAGLLGLSGRSGDLRVVTGAADQGDPDARLAYDVYLHRLRQQIAAMVASMQGLDALVFTGGAGEADARVRSDTCAGLGFLGVTVDESANRSVQGDGVISAAGDVPAVIVVRTGEDFEIARHVRDLVGQ